MRAPAILVSPLIDRGVLKTVFDTHQHPEVYDRENGNSDRWGIAPRRRTLSQLRIFFRICQIDTPASIEVEQIVPAGEPPVVNTLGPNQHAIVALTQALESMVEETAATVAARAKHILSNAQSNIDIAVDRVESFIEKMTAKLAFRDRDR